MSGRVRLAYALCIVLIVASVAVIAWKLPRFRGEEVPQARQPMGPEEVGALLSRPLLLSESQSMQLADGKADYLILFLFTPADCAACLPELRDLSRFDQTRSDVDVMAVMSFSSPDEARQTRENFGLEIPILQDPYGEVLEIADPPKTPWKIVVRRADRQVLFESPPNVSAADREAFLARVRQLGIQAREQARESDGNAGG